MVRPTELLSPSLARDPPLVFFPSEKGQGYFPFSCVPRFIDVSTVSWRYPIMKEIRMAQERKALYEILPEELPDDYPWSDWEDDIKGTTNEDPTIGAVEI
eukprot:6491020-Amphidinium_carterae.2